MTSNAGAPHGSAGTRSRHESVAVVWDDAFLTYNFGPTHPLSPLRMRLTMDLMEQMGLLDLDGVQRITPKPADDELISTVHDPHYIEAVREASLGGPGSPPHGLGLDDNPCFRGMHEAAAWVVGGTVAAAQSVWQGHHDHAVMLGGGLHHAMPDRAEGFCIYNDLAAAITWLLDNGAQRVAYIDVDVHHGDGVERMFWNDPRVLTISLHESGATLFPGTGWPDDIGGPDALGTAVNCALPAETGDHGWRRALHAVVPELLRSFAPDVVVSQHGCDGHRSDPLGHMEMTVEGQTALAADIHRWIHEFTINRWVATGGGGYSIADAVPRAWTSVAAEVLSVAVDPRTPLPTSWRDKVAQITGDPAPATLGDGAVEAADSLGINGAEGVGELASSHVLDPVGMAIQATRDAVFPHHGLATRQT